MDKLRQMIRDKGHTQRSMAEHLGISLSTFHRYLKHDRFTIAQAREMAKILELSDDEILEVFFC